MNPVTPMHRVARLVKLVCVAVALVAVPVAAAAATLYLHDANGNLVATIDDQVMTCSPTDSGWINLSLTTGHTNAGAPYPPTRYRKINGVVYVQVAINRTAANGAVAFNLPQQFRPSAQIYFGGVAYNGQSYDVKANGDVTISASNNPLRISMAFPADQ